jgi:integrase
MEYLFRRGNWFHYKRRIPKDISQFYDGDFVQLSLKTDSMTMAKQRATILNTQLDSLWSDLRSNGHKEAESKLERAKEIAQAHGFPYLTMDQIISAGSSELVSRLNTIQPVVSSEQEKVAAVLGKHNSTAPTIRETLNRFCDYYRADMTNKSAHQIKKWKNPRLKAVDNLISLYSDMPIDKVTRDHILGLREWWFGRIENEGLSPSSANKDFSHLRSLFAFARDDQKLDIDISYLFSRVRFANRASTRPPFETSYIKNNLLNIKNLDGLHPEAQFFLFAMADTGARPSELLGLDAANGDIRLDAPIPYIYIRPAKDKALKTAQSERQIPLVGASLFAFQNLPQGFEHYYRKADQLSANLNGFLRNHGLLPTTEHSIYSLRHSFEDRLTAVEPPEKVQAALMGHKYARPRYGDGPSLEQKKRWLDMICFKV